MVELSTEMLMLGLTVVLGIVQLMVAAQGSTAQRGMGWNLSPRDEKKPDLTGMPGRMDRSFKNLMETFPFFLAGVTGVQLLNRHGMFSVLGSEIYFACRLVYFPVYLAGIRGLRSLIWVASMAGLIMILIQQLVF